MTQGVDFDVDLIRRYATSGPCYTSYPAVNRFQGDITEDDYRKWARRSNEDPIPRPLSLYVHIPFCDSRCFFCAANTLVTKDHSKVAVYLEHLGKEAAMQGALFDKDRIVEQLHWGGGTPTFLATDEIRKLMAVIRRRFSLRTDDGGDYSVEIDWHSADYSKLHVLREVGFNQVSLGVQDITSRVQQAVNNDRVLEVTREISNTTRELGFNSIKMELVYGLPYQTVENFEKTLQAVTEMRPNRLAVYDYAHMPEHFKPQQPVNEADLPGADEKLGILQRTIDHLVGAGYVYVGMDHFARPDDELARAQRAGNLHRNFQGYSTLPDYDLIGLGVSAISKVCDNYSQNTSELDEYYERIDAGKFALERGVELEPDDLLRAEIINRLICHYVVDIEILEKKRQFSFARHFRPEIQALMKMQNDGLLTLDRKSLQVLPAGRLLVRHICMIFDRYLHAGSAGLSRVI